MRCSLCDADNTEFLDLGRQPMANKYPANDSKMASEAFFPLKVYFCTNCKNIQLDTTVSRETMFVDYYYLSSVNKKLVDHYSKFARTLKDAKFVVDIGSNDGISLKPLKEMGIACLGVEPSKNVGQIAIDAGLDTTISFFDDKTAYWIREFWGQPDVITGLSMFSHLQDPHQFIEDVKSLLTKDGKFIVEVEYNVKMLEKLAFERFYLDRIFYFSVTSFQKLFEKHDLVLTDAEVTDIHGGSLRITAERNGTLSYRGQILLEQEKNLTKQVVKNFGKEAKKQVKALKQRLEKFKSQGLRVAAYGCPARTSTITNVGDIGPDLIDFIVDDSPLKQNRFSPGKHIPIVHPSHLIENKPDVLVIFAYEYFDDIRKKLPGEYRYLFPIPVREVL